MSRFLRKIEEIEAEQFFPDKKPWPDGIESLYSAQANVEGWKNKLCTCGCVWEKHGHLNAGTDNFYVCPGNWVGTRCPDTDTPTRYMLGEGLFELSYEPFAEVHV